MSTKKRSSKKAETTPAGAKLEERAMLVNLSIGSWEGRRKDGKTTEDVVTKNHAEQDAGAWWTRIVPPSALQGIGVAVNRARTVHFRLTLPWSDSGPRILSSEMFLTYTEEIRKQEAEYNKAVEAFLAEYPKIVADAAKRLGGLFNADQFPTVDALRGKYRWAVQVLPLPTAGDFRVDLGKEQTEAIRREIETQSQTAMQTAMGDLWNRLHGAVSKIAERLADEKGVVRDSLVKNLIPLCDLLPKMNVTGDPNLEAMRKEVVAQLSGADPEALRKNKTVRADTAKKAADILKQMETFMGESKKA